MDDNAVNLFTQTAKVGVGAATQAVEFLQDPATLADKFSQLQDEFNQGTLTTTWAEKGEKTVTEVQNFLQGMNSNPPGTPTATVSDDPYPLQELEDLVQTLQRLREQLRQA